MSRSSFPGERPNRTRRKVMRECGVGSLADGPFTRIWVRTSRPRARRSSLSEVVSGGKHVGSAASAPDPAAKTHWRRW
jgi:hypothetical protein